MGMEYNTKIMSLVRKYHSHLEDSVTVALWTSEVQLETLSPTVF